ncbi:MAG: CRISPR-associated endonuclease Cas2, partial [Lachnospiraceae bacterium]|nr:CRISPR-associated endonuclease Cas2 [Lachnospiraceae bacterium]
MYIVSYDISDNKVRNKIAKELKNYGVRVQYSVFECDINEKLYLELYKKMLNLVSDKDNESIRIYNVCENCKGK